MPVEVLEVGRRDDAELLEQAARQATPARRSRSPCDSSSSGSTSRPPTCTARIQVRWLSPTWSTDTCSGSTPRWRANERWKPIATLQRPDRTVTGVEQRARDDADRVREVDDPRVRRRRARARAPRSRARRAPCAAPSRARRRRWSPGRCSRSASGTVSSERRAAWPPTRIWTSTKSAPSTRAVEVAGDGQSPVEALALEHPRREPADDLAPLGVDVVQDELAGRRSGRARARGPRRARACTSSRRRSTAIFIPSPRSA